ncbi:hypothetical protein NEUTE1DRAFT_109457 [Neurospora tetrasperma FGSC 2508]|uniref:SH3 domain-containing protein n=1 Tax=Neurospora tetrasperma (strain FGSC 2508 / ATCC MYA-4615 / P0657) TaxID=510951 RepID=F8MFF3_NEUT8|nr:uncharacterized protein NEUTE1DRAFT_109457 [Neurospora tetrasperma FGSC 2508]EGO60007.1 hypothetical protein NEUTE1DRAFT_109457 [Neurospora tetrasperma FGSC 2508]
MTSSHNQPDQPPMTSISDDYVMLANGTYSVQMTPSSGSEDGGDDEREPLMSKESLPTTKASVSEAHADTKKREHGDDNEKESLEPKESLPTTTASVSGSHAGTQSNIAPSNKVMCATHSFRAGNSLQLSFSRGDRLHVIGREGDSWCEAFNPALPDKRGLVPISYFKDIDFWETTLGNCLLIVLPLSIFLFILIGPVILVIYGPSILDWLAFVEPTKSSISSSSGARKVQIPLCGPTKPYESYHLLPVFNRTPYGILDCNHNAPHAELLQSFFEKSITDTLTHFYNRGEVPDEIDCHPWKRPISRDADESLRSRLNKFTPEEWAIQWLFLKEDRSVADISILPILGINTPGPMPCNNDETSLRRRSHQYIAQMEVVRQEIARKAQLEIKELEDKKKNEGDTEPSLWTDMGQMVEQIVRNL